MIFLGIFDGIVAVGKAPINAMIGLINGFIGGLNNIKIPKWVPGIGGKSFSISKIPYLAQGGHLINGQAIVGEAGPELLTAKNGKTTVTPLSDEEKNATESVEEFPEVALNSIYTLAKSMQTIHLS